eukprot:m.142172 g.142172  ORF g.142172 m.142172 type:complete len:56 (+) comp14049_c0_seq21:1398-1565(+)
MSHMQTQHSVDSFMLSFTELYGLADYCFQRPSAQTHNSLCPNFAHLLHTFFLSVA